MKVRSLLILMTLFALPGIGQSSMNYGHCDLLKVWEQVPEKAKVEEELERLETLYHRDLNAMMVEYEEGVSVDPEKWRTWSAEKRDSASHAWKKMEERIVNHRDKKGRELLEKEKELLEPVRARIRTVISQVAEEKGLLYIFDSSSREIFPAGGAPDITQDVIARLDLTNHKKDAP